MSHQHDARELGEGFNDVEVAERTDLKEGHAVLLCIRSGLLRWDLTLESQVKTVSHQNPGYTWGMLVEKTTVLKPGFYLFAMFSKL